MRGRNNQAFTLLELLVAVSITLILAGLMLTVVTNTLNLWQRSQGAFTTASQAALVLDMLDRDLQAAIFRRDGVDCLAVDVIDAPPALVSHGWLVSAAMKPAGIESQRLIVDLGTGATPLIGNVRFGLSGSWFRFLTTNIEADGSLPIAVSYQIARRPVSGAVTASNPADIRYTLFRSAVSTAATFSTGYDITASGYGSTSATPASSRNSKTMMNPNSADALATNVVDFAVWLYVRDEGDGSLRRIYPATNGDLAHEAREVSGNPDANRFPAVVDVMVRILNDAGAALLAEMETGRGHMIRPPDYASDAEWWWGIVEMHSTVHVRRITVKGISP
jgi:prepilin-type N-terminal cleavage/methylation domain-containing protein